MDCDELLAQWIDDRPQAQMDDVPSSLVAQPQCHTSNIDKKCVLAAPAAGGQANLSFKGQLLSAERVNMTDTETEGLHECWHVQIPRLIPSTLICKLCVDCCPNASTRPWSTSTKTCS